MRHQDISVSRSAFHLSKHQKRTLAPLCMHTGPHKPTSNVESCPIDNYDVFTCSRLFSQDTHPFIGSYTPLRLMPHNYSPKSPCFLGSTYDHVPRLRGTLLHPSSPTLILLDKLKHQGLTYAHGPILGLASLHACK